MHRSLAAPSPSVPHRRDLDLSLRVPGSGIRSCAWPGSGCRWGSMRGVVLAAAYPQTPLGTGELHRHDVSLQPRPWPRDDGLTFKRQHSFAPFFDIYNPLFDVSPSDRVGTQLADAAAYLCPAAAGPRFVATNPLPGERLCNRLPGSPALLHALLFLKSCDHQTGRCLRTLVSVAAARSFLRSLRRRHSAPRLASYRSPAERGSKELTTPTARRWGSI